jgi:ABC-2 type transport system permease protein
MKPVRIYAVFLRQMYIIKNLPSRVVPYLLWAVLDIVLWGFITRYLNQVGGAAFSFTPVILGAVVFWDFMQRVQQGVTIPFLEDVWSHNLLNTFASPLKVGEYLSGFILASIVTSSFGLVILIILAELFFGLSMFALGAVFLPAVLVLFLFGIALGIVGASIVLRLGPWAEWFTWPIPAILSPIVGVFYPVSVLPQWVQYISHLLPPTGVFEAMRAVITNGQLDLALLAQSIALSCVYLLLAYILFIVTYRTVVRRGLIARYSAEGE